MLDWFNFALYALQQLVALVFQIDLGVGFTLGDLEIALMVIGIVASALIVKSRSRLGEPVNVHIGRVDGGADRV